MADVGSQQLWRIAVVEGNEALRLGIGALAERDPQVRCAGSFSLEAADDQRHFIAGCDAVLVAGMAHGEAVDQLGGVMAAEAIRAAADGTAPLIVVYASRSDHPALRLRAREAGADAVVPIADVTSADTLARVVRWRREACSISPPLPSDDLRSLGVTSRSRINPFVRRAHELGLHERFNGDQDDLGSRRQVRRVRADLAAVGRIEAMNTDGVAPRRDQTLPSIRQLQRLFRWATQLDPT